MRLAASPPVGRASTTTWLIAAAVLFVMPAPRHDTHDAPNHARAALTKRPVVEIPQAIAPAPCGTLENREATDACHDIEQVLSTTGYSNTPNRLWDAYDRFALAHLNAAGDADLQAWLDAVRPHGAGVGASITKNRILIVWSDPTYLSGARASLFGRRRAGEWTVVARQSLDLDGQYVSIEWARGGVFLIGGVFHGADAGWLSLIGLDARGSRLSAQPVVTHMWAGDERQTRNGVVVRTIVEPKHFTTHLFTNWHEQEVTVAWTGERFRTMRRETEPVIGALEAYCAHRRSCARATLQDVEYVTDRRVRAVFTSLSRECEESAVELAKTDRWRVVDVHCTPER